MENKAKIMLVNIYCPDTKKYVDIIFNRKDFDVIDDKIYYFFDCPKCRNVHEIEIEPWPELKFDMGLQYDINYEEGG